MSTVTISKTTYETLKKKAEAYEHIANLFERDIFVSPPIKSGKKILAEFKKTGKYSSAFLRSLEKGIARSPYFQK